MSLPIINDEIKYVKTKLPDGKSIGIRPWKVKDEKELLFAFENDEKVDETQIKHIITFLRNLVDDKNKFDTVSENSIKKICLEARRLSKGEKIEYIQTCPKCGFKIEDTVDIEKDQKIKQFEESPIVINGNMTITMKDLDWKKSEELFMKYGEKSKTFEFYYLINSIDSFTINGTTYTEFTTEEAEQYIDTLDSDDLDKIKSEFYKKLSSCDLTKKLKCFKCREEFDTDYGDLLSFLVL